MLPDFKIKTLSDLFKIRKIKFQKSQTYTN